MTVCVLIAQRLSNFANVLYGVSVGLPFTSP